MITAEGVKNLLQNEWPQLQQLSLGNYLDNLGRNNIGNQGMILLLERQLPLIELNVGNFLLYSDNNNITAEGLRLMPNYNFSHLRWLSLSNNLFIQAIITLAAMVLNC
jgi:hypothetical protein